MGNWNWLTGNALQYHLLFVEGLTPEQGADAFGADRTELLIMDRKAATHLAVTQGESAPTRFATAGPWLICVEEHSQLGADLDLLHHISQGREAIAVSSDANALGSFTYLVDGTTVTRFEALAPHRRSGHAPDRLLTTMQEIGMLNSADGHGISPREAALDLATHLSGAHLNEQAVTQELPTVLVRRPPLAPPSPPPLSARAGLGRPLGALVPAALPLPQSGQSVTSSAGEPGRSPGIDGVGLDQHRPGPPELPRRVQLP
ncbi:DUF6461 domain-containing protein [Kitasatospora sp. NPDC059599]|uniref:DUF6461 domain-containing protein n=1 Tax=Kitasatospora sp. NPDC059599 TaxID=3346880 RepID=UPI0036906ACF